MSFESAVVVIINVVVDVDIEVVVDVVVAEAHNALCSPATPIKPPPLQRSVTLPAVEIAFHSNIVP